MNVRILIVDDHPMLRRGLRETLVEHPHLTLAGDAATGAQGLALAREMKPDLVVMDIHLPDINGLDVTRQMVDALPATKIVIFSSETDRSFLDESLQAGACGYVPKTSALKELFYAIDRIRIGNPV